jgi:hypothetical protein
MFDGRPQSQRDFVKCIEKYVSYRHGDHVVEALCHHRLIVRIPNMRTPE